MGDGLEIRTQPHDFAKGRSILFVDGTPVNVLKLFSGGTVIVPWKSPDVRTHSGLRRSQNVDFARRDRVIWRVSIASPVFFESADPINIFSSMAESLGYKLELSPAGRTCEQIIHALGSIRAMGLVARGTELLKFLDRLAHEDSEVELEGEEGDGA